MFNHLLRIFLDNTGARLRLRDGSLLPARCAICNRTVTSPPRRVRITCSAVGEDSEQIVVHLHMCRWHASRRLLVIGVSAVIALVCGMVVRNLKERTPPTAPQSVAAIGLLVSTLILINSLFFNVYFRGLSMEEGKMEIKGFGRAFRESLRPEDIQFIPKGGRPPGAIP